MSAAAGSGAEPPAGGISGVLPASTLICFAVPFEAKPFLRLARGRSDLRVLVTGMGANHAARCVEGSLRAQCTVRVFTCGFAGALNPGFKRGDVIFETADVLLRTKLIAAGAKAASFHCTGRIAVTASEKAALRRRTTADAVEMESGVIQRICSEAGVPCATVRAISDEADEDLPFDFNAFMTRDQKLSSIKLFLAILSAPRRISAMVRLGRHSAYAAGKLSRVLMAVLTRTS